MALLPAVQDLSCIDLFIFVRYCESDKKFYLCGWDLRESFLEGATIREPGHRRNRDDGTYMEYRVRTFEREIATIYPMWLMSEVG